MICERDDELTVSQLEEGVCMKQVEEDWQSFVQAMKLEAVEPGNRR